jgi:hypothetical protein
MRFLLSIKISRLRRFRTIMSAWRSDLKIIAAAAPGSTSNPHDDGVLPILALEWISAMMKMQDMISRASAASCPHAMRQIMVRMSHAGRSSRIDRNLMSLVSLTDENWQESSDLRSRRSVAPWIVADADGAESSCYHLILPSSSATRS